MNSLKNITKTTKLFSVIFIITVLFSSCVSTTLIQSIPSGAQVYLNQQVVGVTPYTMRDTKVVWSTTNVELKKEGYQPFYTTIVRNEQAAIGPIIGGFFVYIPWLWAMKYNPVHRYELAPVK